MAASPIFEITFVDSGTSQSGDHFSLGRVISHGRTLVTVGTAVDAHTDDDDTYNEDGDDDAPRRPAKTVA
jgi:hypothetical protein